MQPIFLRGVGYHVDDLVPIERVPALANDPQMLAAFRESGHKTFAQAKQSLAEQAITCAKKSLAAAGLVAKDVSAIVIGFSEMREPNRFPEMLSTELLRALELTDVVVVGVTLAGCANYSSCMRVARNMVVAEGLKNVLVIETDQVRGDMKREVYEEGTAAAIFADGACSFIVSADDGGKAKAGDFELIGIEQTIKPLDWKNADSNMIAANNIFGYTHTVEFVLGKSKLTRSVLRKTFLSSINTRIATDIVEILNIDAKSLYTANTARTGHVWSCDNLISLTDFCAAEKVKGGEFFLLISNAESYFSAIVVRKR